MLVADVLISLSGMLDRQLATTMDRICEGYTKSPGKHHGCEMRVVCCYAVTLVLSAGAAPTACAQSYPVKPIRIVVTSFGSGPDIMARLIGQKLTEAWGQQIVVDARIGASGRLASEHLARAAADGYTLMVVTSNFSIAAAMYEKQLNFDPIRDFSPVILMAATPFILVVHPSIPAKSVKELVALAKSWPGQLHHGSSGAASPAGLACQRLKSMAGIDIVDVPYKGIAQAVTDTTAGQIQLTFGVVPTVLPVVRQGRLRGLAVTSLKRTPLAPELPTIAESVPGYEVIGWYGLVAPARTPGEIIARLNAEVLKALHTTEMRDRLASLGADIPNASTAQEFASFLVAQIQQSRQLIRESGARPD
jgi:tripartite-type tricarboxylate transporter receptor subunit TctC